MARKNPAAGSAPARGRSGGSWRFGGGEREGTAAGQAGKPKNPAARKTDGVLRIRRPGKDLRCACAGGGEGKYTGFRERGRDSFHPHVRGPAASPALPRGARGPHPARRRPGRGAVRKMRGGHAEGRSGRGAGERTPYRNPHELKRGGARRPVAFCPMRDSRTGTRGGRCFDSGRGGTRDGPGRGVRPGPSSFRRKRKDQRAAFVSATQRSILPRSMGRVTVPSSRTLSWKVRMSNFGPSSRSAISRSRRISRLPVM